MTEIDIENDPWVGSVPPHRQVETSRALIDEGIAELLEPVWRRLGLTPRKQPDERDDADEPDVSRPSSSSSSSSSSTSNDVSDSSSDEQLF